MAHAADLIRDGIVELLPRLRRFARSLSRNTHDADDLVQLAVERALARAEQWQPGTRLESWMYSIVKNAWIDEHRARRRRAALLIAAPVDDVPGAGSAETGLSVEQALQRLPEEQRLVVALVLIEGLSYREAADILEVPIGTVTSRLARAREALMTCLSEEMPA
jgi:RNA polymerase sigma-70 factor (ECF subfamily)